jgi:enterobacterial common antigen flippase
MVEPLDEASAPSLTMPALRATAVVGIGSVATLGLSVVTMKVYALLIGPNGVGLLALMQAVVNIAVIVTSFGVATSVIGALAAALGTGDLPLVAAIERAAMRLGLIGGMAGAAVLVLVREPLAELALGSRERGLEVILLAAAMIFTLAAVIQIGLLIGHHRIREVTAIGVGTGIASMVLGILLVSTFGLAGLAPALLVTAVVQFGLARLAAARRSSGNRPPTLTGMVPVTRNLLRLGVPVAGSQLATAGAAFLVPLIVLQSVGQAEVGLYRAAAAVSVGYLTFFLSALTQDYLPRISAAGGTAELGVLIERRMRLVLGLGVPVIVALLAVGPWLIQFLYSADFQGAFGVMQWQLIGDLLRLPAWVLAFVLLARRTGMTYLGIEVLGGVSLLIATVVGLGAFGLPGAGVGYAVSQAVYFMAVWIMVRRQVPTAPGRLQAVVIGVAVGCALLLAADVPPVPRLIILGTASLVLAAIAWPRLYRLHAAGEL